MRVASIGGIKTVCAGCGEFISGIHYWSSLFQSHHQLCEHCHRHEEDQIEEKGTNNIPKLLAFYNSGYKG